MEHNSFLNSFSLQQFVKDSFLHNLHEFHEIKLNVMKCALNFVSWNRLNEIFHSVSLPQEYTILPFSFNSNSNSNNVDL